MFCPECGTDHHAADRAEAETAQAAIDREIEIERLRTERDIEVAKIQARQEASYNETRAEVAAIEAEAGVEAAEAKAEALTDVLTPPDPEPVIIMDGETGDSPELAEPEPSIEPRADTEPEPVTPKKSAWSYW